MKRIALLLIVLLLAAALGCSRQGEINTAPGEDLAVEEKELTAAAVASTENINSLDPLEVDSPLEYQIAAQLYDTLVGFDPDAQTIQPLLAEEYRENEELTGLIFVLKQGISFHDGTMLDARAVKQSLDRWRSSFSYPELSPVQEVAELDERTVLVTWKRDKAELLAALSGVRASILSPGALREGNGGFSAGTYQVPQQIAAGTGPYLVQEWVDGGWVTLVAAPKYYREEPAVKRWRIEMNKSVEDALLDLRGNRVDFVQSLEPDIIDRSKELELEGNLHLAALPTGYYLYLNPESFAELPDRQALAGILDRGLLSLNTKGMLLPQADFLPAGTGATFSLAVEAAGTAKLLEADLADLTWTAAPDFPPFAYEALLRQLQEKGLRLEAAQAGETNADLVFMLWTQGYHHDAVELLLREEMGIGLQKGLVSRKLTAGLTQYVYELGTSLAAGGQLIPLATFRQAVMEGPSGRGTVITAAGYFDFAAVQP